MWIEPCNKIIMSVWYRISRPGYCNIGHYSQRKRTIWMNVSMFNEIWNRLKYFILKNGLNALLIQYMLGLLTFQFCVYSSAHQHFFEPKNTRNFYSSLEARFKPISKTYLLVPYFIFNISLLSIVLFGARKRESRVFDDCQWFAPQKKRRKAKNNSI